MAMSYGVHHRPKTDGPPPNSFSPPCHPDRTSRAGCPQYVFPPRLGYAEELGRLHRGEALAPDELTQLDHEVMYADLIHAGSDCRHRLPIRGFMATLDLLQPASRLLADEPPETHECRREKTRVGPTVSWMMDLYNILYRRQISMEQARLLIHRSQLSNHDSRITVSIHRSRLTTTARSA